MDWGDDDISGYGRLSLEYGLRLMASHEEWAKWAIDRRRAARDDRPGHDPGPATRGAGIGGMAPGTGAVWCALVPMGKGIVKWRGPRRTEQGDPPWVSASPRAAMSR